ncbi:PREDICTED: uncharacterized protein LOC108565760 [Nicrophorus vespilloides]|uniref:Uncharacterized protein LOC108565760 n=1 Tax=Nicrophorus vespilloides TaxID=110193 RepID=A0ABM1N202_NICVS|nr:PREDICTED: uncharacterized protein LOC108565760 [Nicrophorus vespilloides]XP_017780852.1 PREDICTED: uncharacterized protein LOC108565760 [Nicrophorus vespilloides]
MTSAIIKCFYVLLVSFFLYIQFASTLPVGNPETTVEVMLQIPQWHCMRYRKFELVRRCRSYKHGARRN